MTHDQPCCRWRSAKQWAGLAAAGGLAIGYHAHHMLYILFDYGLNVGICVVIGLLQVRNCGRTKEVANGNGTYMPSGTPYSQAGALVARLVSQLPHITCSLALLTRRPGRLPNQCLNESFACLNRSLSKRRL